MKHEKRYRSTGKVANRLKRFKIAPYLEILLGLGLLVALGWAIYTYGVPFLKNLYAHTYSCAKAEATPSPSPVPTPEPTRDPYPDHALYGADLKSLQTEIVVPEYQYVADVSVFEDTVVAATGNYTIGTFNVGTYEITAATMTVSVTGYSGVYDGATHTATATPSVEGATITWSVDNGEFTSTVPSISRENSLPFKVCVCL